MEESIIRVRLDDLKDVCKDFRHRQQDLDALNDLGYRLPLKKTDAERLHNLNNRWTTLSGDASDRQRTLQASLLQQQNFNDKCEEWMMYLAQVEKDLAAPVAGNYPELLEQQTAFEVGNFDSLSFPDLFPIEKLVQIQVSLLNTFDILVY